MPNKFESKENQEQHSDSYIAGVVAEHPTVWQSERACEESKKTGQENWKIQNEMFVKLENQTPNCWESGEVKAKKREFRELYEEINPTKKRLEKQKENVEIGESEKKQKIENLKQKLHELMTTMIKADIYQKTKAQATKFKVVFTDKTLQDKVKAIKLTNYAEFIWEIDENGKLDSTLFQTWTSKNLEDIVKPEIEKNQKNTENTNSVLLDKLIEQIYRNSIKETNAHFFGIFKSRQEINDLADSKKQAIADEIDEQKKNPSQNPTDPKTFYSPN